MVQFFEVMFVTFQFLVFTCSFSHGYRFYFSWLHVLIFMVIGEKFQSDVLPFVSHNSKG
jgi:hypothetical protein